MPTKTDNVLEAAYEELEQLSGKPECYEQYVLTEMAISDYITRIDEATNRGIKQGMEQGIYFTAKNLKNEGTSINLIAKCTGLSVEDIEKL